MFSWDHAAFFLRKFSRSHCLAGLAPEAHAVSEDEMIKDGAADSQMPVENQ